MCCMRVITLTIKHAKTGYLIAAGAAEWAMPCAYLCDAAPFFKTTHRRNLDEDAVGVPEIERAKQTRHKVES